MAQRAGHQRVGRAIHAHQPAFAIQRHVFLVDLAALHRDARGRQRVDHLVGEQHAAPALLGRAVQPVHARVEFGRQRGGEALALALAQVGAGFEDQVAVRQAAGRGERLERRLRERAAAAAQFEEVRRLAQRVQHRREHVRHAAREQFAQLRRGDEVAGCAELGLARAVVAQPRRVQAALHELRERHRAVRGDLFAQLLQQAVGMRAFVGAGFGEAGGHAICRRLQRPQG